MESVIQDVRVGLRVLWKDRAFSATATLTLAVCIGANTTLFSVVENVVLQPLAVPDSARLVIMGNQIRARPYPGLNSGVPEYYDRLRETTVFESQALIQPRNQSIDRGGSPARIRVLAVTPSFFSVVHVPPLVGRAFTDDEAEIGRDKSVVLSYRLWQSEFGGDPRAVGRDLRLDGEPFVIVGIMPKTFTFMDDEVMLWRPLAFTPEQRSRPRFADNSWQHIARLKPDATIAQGQAQIDALNSATLDRYSEQKERRNDAGFHTRLEPLQDYLVGDVKTTLYLLWAGALFVLLIGCVNIANLVLIRSRARLKELATRLALGAARNRLARQLMIETVMLAFASMALGVGLGYLMLRSLGAVNIQDLPRGSQIHFDALVIAYTVALAVLIGLVLGLIPFAIAMRANVNAVLRAEGRTGTAGHRARVLGRGLVVAQVGLTFVLLVSAGLLLASFRNVLAVDPGFRGDRVLTATVDLPSSRYPNGIVLRQFMDDAERQLRALPGVESVGATNTIPFSRVPGNNLILAEGHQQKSDEPLIPPRRVYVTPGYFQTMGAAIVAGRFFDDRDGPSAERVIIIDERLAQRFWPAQNAVGRRLYFPSVPGDPLAVSSKTVFLTVVGVIQEMKLHTLTEDPREGTYYLPFGQNWERTMTFAIRTMGAPAGVSTAVRRVINQVDQELPVFNVRTIEEWEDRSLASRKSAVLLSAGFGAVAVLLAIIGIYGMLAYVVAQRTKEIGIRLAVGSTVLGIFQLVLHEGFLLIACGFVVGGLGAVAVRKTLQGQLFDLSAADPVILGYAGALLAIVGVVACLGPAWHASKIDPVRALAD